MSDEEIARQQKLADEAAVESERVRAIKEKAETTWVRFVTDGKVTSSELRAQRERVARQRVVRVRLREIEAEQKFLEKELYEINIHCIHLDEKGKSAFERGIYDMCRICPDAR